jgi:hypothetical protein
VICVDDCGKWKSDSRGPKSLIFMVRIDGMGAKL